MHPRAAIVTLRLALVAMPLWLGACAATGPSEVSESVPRDFAVSIAVASNDADLEPAWYILEADGTLRAALGAPTPRSPIPPRVRTLTPGARAAVWRAVQHAQWIPGTKPGDADSPTALPPGEAVAGPAELAEVYVAAGGGRWSGRVLAAPGSASAERLQAVIRELRRLAWLPDGA
jgi:hypothetical protein